jgi:hypothetical protein
LLAYKWIGDRSAVGYEKLGSGTMVFEEVVDFGGWRGRRGLEANDVVERVERRREDLEYLRDILIKGAFLIVLITAIESF